MRAAQIQDGKVVNFIIVDAFTDSWIDPQNAQIGDFWDGTKFNRPHDPEDDPATPFVPESVPMLNARLALIAAGLNTAADDYIAAMDGKPGEEARAYWNFAQNVRRDHPLVISLGSVLGKSSSELDQLFIEAAKLA